MYRRIKQCYPGQTLRSKKEAKCDPVSGIRLPMGTKKPTFAGWFVVVWIDLDYGSKNPDCHKAKGRQDGAQ